MAKAGHSLQATTILKALYGLVESNLPSYNGGQYVPHLGYLVNLSFLPLYASLTTSANKSLFATPN